MRVLVFASVLLITILPIGHVYACSDPAGVKGQMIFNDDYKVMQFCDGTDWHAMIGNGGGGASVPTGAVMAFNLSACPSGWSAFTAAQGRFLRGVDPSGTIDPSGTRTAGNIQLDALQGHVHSTVNVLTTTSAGWNLSGGGGQFYTGPSVPGSPSSDGTNGTPRIARETRPVNVAVLYCEKD